MEDRLRRLDTRLVQKAREFLDAWPPPAREVLARRMLGLVDSPRMRAEWLSLLGGQGARRPDAAEGVMRPVRKAELLSEETYRQAMVYQDLKEYGRALRVLNGLVSSYPVNAKLRSDRGIAYALSGRNAEAVKDLEAAIRIDPYFPAAYLSLGSILTGRREYKKAWDLYETALRHDCFKIDPATCKSIQDERDRMRSLSR